MNEDTTTASGVDDATLHADLQSIDGRVQSVNDNVESILGLLTPDETVETPDETPIEEVSILTQPVSFSGDGGAYLVIRAASSTGSQLSYAWYCLAPGAAEWLPVADSDSASIWVDCTAEASGSAFQCCVIGESDTAYSDIASIFYVAPVEEEEPVELLETVETPVDAFLHTPFSEYSVTDGFLLLFLAVAFVALLGKLLKGVFHYG